MARIEVPMPQMGESIAEGTVSKWLKEIGESVERDEPILEISTDKVDAEIPAPASGTLVAIEVSAGETVEVGTIVAYIDTDGGPPAANGKSGAAVAEAPAAEEPDESVEPEEGVEPEEAPEPEAEAAEPAAPRAPGEPASAEERLRTRSTPVVRKIAEEHGVDIARVEGTGHAGRVTKQDILGYIESGAGAEEAPARPAPRPAADEGVPATAAAPSDLWQRFYGEVQHPEFPVREADTVEPMDKIRRLTAEH
ncbi:MAG: E3 binding domain-containing protein, partial [Gemmatimonadetes bacterium]|nr:E3 binding domain-containing protein [Gemmatimonadota bacterium]